MQMRPSLTPRVTRNDNTWRRLTTHTDAADAALPDVDDVIIDVTFRA